MKPRPRQPHAGAALERPRRKAGIEKPCRDGAAAGFNSRVDDLQEDPEYPWLKLKARVEHKAFGQGTLVRLNGTGSLRTATIQFDVHGERELMLAFASVHLRASHA